MNKYLVKLRTRKHSEVPSCGPDKTDKTHPDIGFVSFAGSPGRAFPKSSVPVQQSGSTNNTQEDLQTCRLTFPKAFYARTVHTLCERCPDHVEPERWRQALADTDAFLSEWGEQAEALGWTARDLFGLHEVPPNPHPSYRRLSRYDCTGLIWLLQGRPVVALTEATAAIRMPTGSITTYRKHGKPAYGPLGDSIDDFVP